MEDIYRRIDADPRFHALARARSRLGWTLSATVLLAYFAFIFAIAFAPDWLAQPLHAGTVVTTGILAGVLVIVLCVSLTGVYIWQANRRYDGQNRAIVDEASLAP